MKLQFKVLEEKDNALESVIEKTGDVVHFTLGELRVNMSQLKKGIAELQKEWQLAEATKKNISNHHPHIAMMSLEDLTAAQMYRDAIGIATESSDKLKEWQETFDSQEKQLEQILEQTGLEIPGLVDEKDKEGAKDAK